MRFHRRTLATLLAAGLVTAGPAWAGAGAASPEALAQSIEKALESGDGDALLAEVQLDEVMSELVFFVLDMPGSCGAASVCSATARAMDAKGRAQQAENLTAQGAEMRIAPEGVIEISQRPAGDVEGEATLLNELPYARVEGEYRVVTGSYTKGKRAELQATTPQTAADATIAAGVFVPALRKREHDFKRKATALPADGGEPGAAFLDSVKAVAAAVEANDVDAAAAALGDWGRAVLGPTDSFGKPRPPGYRGSKLHAEAVRLVVSARVLGGWQLGDFALLVIEGTNGIGNTVRGAQFMERRNGTWADARNHLVEIPR